MMERYKNETSDFDAVNYSNINFSRKKVMHMLRPIMTKHHKSPDYEQMAAEGNYFIHLIAVDMSINRNYAGRIIKSILHSFRDLLSVHDAVRLSQGLPLALKALFFDHYAIAKIPVKFTRTMDFLKYVRDNSDGRINDFPSPAFTVNAIRSVFGLLYDVMDKNHLDHFISRSGAMIEEILDRNDIPM